MVLKYAIIGDPVEHSFSPAMHEAGFKALNIDAEYHRIKVTRSDIKTSLEFLRQNYSGWNVTFPLKERILPFLDYQTLPASLIGAVNTVKVVSGKLYGHNTDGEGFVESLIDRGFDFKNKKIVILGAGGSAKAIAITLAEKEADILILNRTVAKAEKLAEQICRSGGKASFGILANGRWLKEADLLIQTTSIGMNGERYPFDLYGINQRCLVVDLIYNPPITPFLAQAKDYGCKIMNGSEMLLFQGVLAWKYWFDIEAPIEAMRSGLAGVCEGYQNGGLEK